MRRGLLLRRRGAGHTISIPRANHYAFAMNYWFWLLIILVPVLVFSVKPEASTWRRAGRLVLAAAFCYGLLFLTVYWQDDQQWAAVSAYQEKHRECIDHACADEPRLTDFGSLYAFIIVFGLIPAAGYTGLWELIWRLYYRKRIRALPAFRGRLLSNLLIFFATIAAYPTWLFLSRLAY